MDIKIHAERFSNKIVKTIEKSLKKRYGDVPKEFTITLELLDDNISMWYEAKQTVKEEGLLITDRFGVKHPHPLIKIAYDCQNQIYKLLTEFGLTAKSKNKLDLDTDADGDAAEELLRTLTM